MVKHYNPSISENALRIFRTKGDYLASEINDIIQPTIEVSKITNIVKGATCSNATSATIFTTPSDKDFYLTGCQLGYVRDVTATSTFHRVRAFIDNVVTDVLFLPAFTLTAGQDSIFVSYENPIKITRNTAITISHSAATANILSSAVIYGYTEETTS